MDVWGCISCVDSTARLPLLSACAAGLAIGLGALTATRTDWVMPAPSQPVHVVREFDSYLCNGMVYTDPWMALQNSRALAAQGTLRGGSCAADVRALRLEVGYEKHEAGAASLSERWVGREQLWWRESRPPAPEGRGEWAAPTEAEIASLRSQALLLLAADPRVVGKTFGVSQRAPFRTWVNQRAVAADAGLGLAWGCGAVMGVLGWMEIAARGRPRRVKAGLCPACAYALAGTDVARCPECGNELTLHERSVLAAMETHEHSGPRRAAPIL